LRRQNRRTELIQTALAPARDRLGKSTYRKLCAALALVISTESMVVFRDVLQIEEAEARVVEEWMIRVLTQEPHSSNRAPRKANLSGLSSNVARRNKNMGGPPPSGRIVGTPDKWNGQLNLESVSVRFLTFGVVIP